MDIQVLSRKLIYIDGKKIRRTRLFFDNYHFHSRDIFYSKKNEIVIKIDQCNFEESPRNRWKSNTENQCKIELKLWKRFRESEKIFFPEPISGGFFMEDGHKVHWIVQKLFYKDGRRKPSKHKDWAKLEKIFDKYNIEDVFDDDRNCFVDVSNRLICVDWAI